MPILSTKDLDRQLHRQNIAHVHKENAIEVYIYDQAKKEALMAFVFGQEKDKWPKKLEIWQECPKCGKVGWTTKIVECPKCGTRMNQISVRS